MKIPLIKPFMNDTIKQKVIDVLDSGYWTEGTVTKEFEDKLKQIIGCRYVLAVSSCTTGLEMALRCLNIGTGDEVIVPDYTYPATADAVAIVGAKAVIVDVDPETMLIDCNEIKKAITNRTKAVIPVSIFGNPLDYSILNQLKQEYGFFIIEDAACSLGSSFDGIMTGNLADISVFSHHPRKFITTGEGGTITTNNEEWYEWMYAYKHFGITQSKDRQSTEFSMTGTNYKLSNILASIGSGQLDFFNELLGKRIELAKNYLQLISQIIPEMRIPATTDKGVHSYQSFCVFTYNRDEIILKMRQVGIETQIGTYSLALQPAFQTIPSYQIVSSKNSKTIFNKVLTLPLYHELTFEEQTNIIKQLAGLINEN